MKIAIVTNNYKPYSGGVVSSIDGFARQLAKTGHQVYIVTFDFLGAGSSVEQGVNIVRINSPIRFTYKKNHIAIPWQPNKEVLKALQKIKPDIIHSQHPFLLGKSAQKASKVLGIPVVFTHHSQYERFAYHFPISQSLTTSAIRYKVLDYCHKVDGMIVPSQSIYDHILKIKDYDFDMPVKILPSGILPIFHNPDFETRPCRKTFKLLKVSRFSKEKDIPALLDMFAKLKGNFELKLVGFGSELDSLVEYAYNELGLSPQKVSFIVKPPKAVLVEIYRKSDLFVFTSTAEVQPQVLSESMISGTPVVSLYGPGQNDIVEQGKNGFLVKDIGEMTEKIKLIASDSALHQNMQKHAYTTGNKYTSEQLTKNLIGFYREVINNYQP